MTKRRIIFVALALFVGTTALVLTVGAQNVDSTVNPRTDPAKVELGRLLFWDPILSGSKDTACATCHHPDFAYADGRDLSRGTGAVGLGPKRGDISKGQIPVVKRNSPTILNVAFNGRRRQSPDGDGRFDGSPQSVNPGAGADVLGQPGAESRNAGARADQGARRNAGPRLSGSRGGGHGRRPDQEDPRVRRAVPGRLWTGHGGRRRHASATPSLRLNARSWR